MTTASERENHQPKAIVGLYGAGGFGREVMPVLMDVIEAKDQGEAGMDYEVVFVEDEPSEATVNGYRVLSEAEFFGHAAEKKFFNVSIGDSAVRERLAASCIEKGAAPISIRALNATIYDRNEIGAGAIICANSTITSNAKIGKFFHSNIYSYVAHDCVIGDYVTFAPNVQCNGNVHIEDHAYIGTGAILKQGTAAKPLVIGKGAVVGMGAVVTKDVAPYTTVVGNPAKPHVKA